MNRDRHLEKAEDVATKKLGAIRNLYYLTEECFEKIFSAMIGPTLLYGSEIWGAEDTEHRANRTITTLTKEILGAKRNLSNNLVRCPAWRTGVLYYV